MVTTNSIKYLIIPCYKNKPQLFYIKLLETKENAIEYAESVRELLTSQINSRIESNDEIESEQKTYDFMMLQENISIFIVGVNEEGKGNKFYSIKINPKNNKRSLESIKITSSTELPQIKTFDYIKKPKNIPFEN